MVYVYGSASGRLGVQISVKKNILTPKYRTGHARSSCFIFLVSNNLKRDLNSGLFDYNVQAQYSRHSFQKLIHFLETVEPDRQNKETFLALKDTDIHI